MAELEITIVSLHRCTKFFSGFHAIIFLIINKFWESQNKNRGIDRQLYSKNE